jgi:hypothetical protein
MGRYDIDCGECLHEGTDECDECSIEYGNNGCACHINPPCSFCTDLKFEEKLGTKPKQKDNFLQQCIDAGFVIIGAEPSKTVLCDFCNKDWSDSDKSGGFLFQSKAVCPDCAPGMIVRIEQYHEQSFIRGHCPAELSFKDWVLSLRD